ncbi:hypothetical protein EXU48_03515 [Occultella glacieicola]|uniref:DUF1579 domain-containing protein n=1 Tax=Occultella glacieicola TaxID=2518684 RepID=A0ABY2E835_9MICO|nr:hypothetical protein [Occultella glacieicola]TDE97286.1 hypothetical protein EXU48_03515 [Occultella glacieicola]
MSIDTNDQPDAQDHSQEAPPQPSAVVRALDRLVGTWAVTGGAQGTVRYEWMPGGHFLIQHVELEQYGQSVTGFEVIGHLHPFGEPVSEEVASRFYDSMGNTFDYVYELKGDTLTIWAGAQDSPAYFRGTFTDDDRAMSGDWIYPGGGGYPSTMTRQQG